MFFIVNKTKQTLVLGDLGVTLGPRQAVDLDKVVSRDKSDNSKSLKNAKKNGQVEVRSKDGEKPKHPEHQVISQPINVIDNLKKELIEEMKAVISQQTKVPTDSVSKEDLKNFAREIIQSMPESKTVIMQGNNVVETRTDEEVEMNEDVLGEMNKRIVNKIVKNAEGTGIEYKEEKQKNDLDNNIAELEGLLDL